MTTNSMKKNMNVNEYGTNHANIRIQKIFLSAPLMKCSNVAYNNVDNFNYAMKLRIVIL